MERWKTCEFKVTKDGRNSRVYNHFHTLCFTFFRFVRPVAESICGYLKEQSVVINQARDPLDSPFPFTQADASSSKTTGDDTYRKHAREKHDERVERNYRPIDWRELKDSKPPRIKLSSPSGTYMSISTTPPSSVWEAAGTHPKQLYAKSTKFQLPVLWTVKKHNTVGVDYQTYHQSDCSLCHDVTVSSYIARLVKIAKSQKKEPFFNAKKPIPIVGFLATFILVCGSSKIHKGDAMLVFPRYVQESLANEHNSGMSAEI